MLERVAKIRGQGPHVGLSPNTCQLMGNRGPGIHDARRVAREWFRRLRVATGPAEIRPRSKIQRSHLHERKNRVLGTVPT